MTLWVGAGVVGSVDVEEGGDGRTARPLRKWAVDLRKLGFLLTCPCCSCGMLPVVEPVASVAACRKQVDGATLPTGLLASE